jgi:hypothetical protein
MSRRCRSAIGGYWGFFSSPALSIAGGGLPDSLEPPRACTAVVAVMDNSQFSSFQLLINFPPCNSSYISLTLYVQQIMLPTG